jgi:hypothetical protein
MAEPSEIVDTSAVDFLSKPYFYTLQDHLPTQRKQVTMWCALTYKFLTKQNLLEFSRPKMEADDFPLFNNPRIKRRLDKAFIGIILDELVRTKKIDWKDQAKQVFLIFKYSVDDLAEAVYKWAKGAGKIGKLATIQEMCSHDDCQDTIFFGMPEETIFKACQLLETKGKLNVIDLGEEGNLNNMGVKFK